MYWYKKKNRYNEYKERNMGKFMLKALEREEKKIRYVSFIFLEYKWIKLFCPGLENF